MIKKRKTKKMSKELILFIICCCALPVINWLIFYVYAHFSSFTMAFMDKDGVWSFDNFIRLWNELKMPDSDIRIAIKNTLLTFGIQVLMFPVTVLVSYFIYKKIPGASIYRVLFFLPSIIFSVALAMIFQKIIGVNGFIAQGIQELLHLDYTPELLADSQFANTTVLLHMVWLTFPGDLVIWGGTFARIPTEVLEAGQVDGVNWWQEFTKIIVPIVWPTVGLKMVLLTCGIFGASGAVFLLTGGDFGTMTLSAWMYLQLYTLSGNQDTSNAFNYMSAVGLVMTAIAITISLLVRKWSDKVFDEVEF